MNVNGNKQEKKCNECQKYFSYHRNKSDLCRSCRNKKRKENLKKTINCEMTEKTPLDKKIEERIKENSEKHFDNMRRQCKELKNDRT